MKAYKEIVKVGVAVTGQEIDLIKYVIDSEKEGKTIYIQGGIHGGEITLPIIKKLFDYLKTNINVGKVIFIPFANPLAWQQQAYCYTFGKFNLANGKDFNRYFGLEDESDINCKIANALLNEAKKADFAIDLHTAMESEPYVIFSTLNYANYVNVLNLNYNYLCEPTDSYLNTFDVQLYKNNVPNFVIECGSHDSYNEKNITKVYNGIKNLLAYFNVIKAKINLNKSFKYFTNLKTVRSENSGIVNYLKPIGSRVVVGENLCSVVVSNLLNETINVTSKYDGIVFRFNKTHICKECDQLVQIIEEKDIKEYSINN